MWVYLLAEEPRSLHLALSGLLLFGVLAFARRDWRERLMAMIARGSAADPPRAVPAVEARPAPKKPQHEIKREDREKLLAMHKKNRRHGKGSGRRAA